MDCLRNFIININQASTFSGAGVNTWVNGNRHGWSFEQLGTSTFNVEGFKNINLHGIEMIGYMQPQVAAATGQCQIDNFGMDLYLDSSLPNVSGNISTFPNYWSLNTNNVAAKTVRLNKFTNKIIFNEPLTSLKFVNFERLVAHGTDWQTANTVSLDYDLTFVFYYKYEGE